MTTLLGTPILKGYSKQYPASRVPLRAWFHFASQCKTVEAVLFAFPHWEYGKDHINFDLSRTTQVVLDARISYRHNLIRLCSINLHSLPLERSFRR